eukprot:TRINITY_DN3492_c3_g3_i1.p1 TRINITY_DN3492_c3_g3~~TRINITY_DN3492_c3_g3_i1.p1  ORF type:complete len:1082 (+),score=442.85 TRINITY_DN3492_c3_g3_i1:53-3247(+)
MAGVVSTEGAAPAAPPPGPASEGSPMSGSPTASPDASPTASPGASPTASPDASPTASPALSPSASPALSPDGLSLTVPAGQSGRQRRRGKSDEVLCRELFDIIDSDLGGSISREEMALFVRLTDPKAPPQLIDAVIADALLDEDGEISAESFQELILSGHLGERPGVLLERYKGQRARIKHGDVEEYLQRLPVVPDVPVEEAQQMLHGRQVAYLRRTANPRELFEELFNVFDEGRRGAIDHKAVGRLVRMVIPDASAALVHAVVTTADKDNSGEIDFGEFIVALEEGSLGVPPEELLPVLRKNLQRLREGRVKVDDIQTGATITPEDREEALAAVRALQAQAEERRKQTQAASEAEKRKRLRGRLIDFYARHNPEKVREDEIMRVVNAAVSRSIDEDDLFRQLYKKYNLDESGEKKEESDESDWDKESDLSSIDSDRLRNAPTEEERKALKFEREKRILKKKYREAKREEALHKAVQNQIKKETREERLRANAAMMRFVAEYKSVEERREEAKLQRRRDQDREAEEKLRQSENRFARMQNRRDWLEALEDAKAQRFEERCRRVDLKRAWVGVRSRLVHIRKSLRKAVVALESESVAHVRLAQAQRIMRAFVARQQRALDQANLEPQLEQAEKELAGLESAVDAARKRLRETIDERDRVYAMYIANKYNAKSLEEITEGMQLALEQVEKGKAVVQRSCHEQLVRLGGSSQADVDRLRIALNSALTDLEAQVKAKEDLRMKEDHMRGTKAAGLVGEMEEYKAKCDREVLELKDKLLGIYPTLMMDVASHIGKAVGPKRQFSPGVPKPDVDQDGAASVLSLYQRRPGALGGEAYEALLQFDDSRLSVAADAGPASASEALPPDVFGALRRGEYARLWRWKLFGRSAADEAEAGSSATTSSSVSAVTDTAAAVCGVPVGGQSVWNLRTFRGSTVRVTLRHQPLTAATARPRRAPAAPPPASPVCASDVFREIAISGPDDPAAPPPPPSSPANRRAGERRALLVDSPRAGRQSPRPARQSPRPAWQSPRPAWQSPRALPQRRRASPSLPRTPRRPSLPGTPRVLSPRHT